MARYGYVRSPCRFLSYAGSKSNAANLISGKDGGVFKDTFIHQIWCGHYHAIAVVGEMRVNISPSTFIANMQTAFTDTLHKDMTLDTPHGKKSTHAVVMSSLSEVASQKAQADKSNVNLVEELKQLSAEQLEMLLKYFYGISSEVSAEDLKALHEAAKQLQSSQLVHDCAKPQGNVPHD
jgi:hypothetical protein